MDTSPAIPHVFYAAKGGQGTTVSAAAAALVHADAGRRTLLIDAAEHHDSYAVLGLPEPADTTAIVTAAPNLDLVAVDPGREPTAATGSYDVIVIDAGRDLSDGPSHKTLVTRACYLALRRALALAVTPDDVILLEEPGRSLRRNDVEAVLGRPVVAVIGIDPAVSRTIDAGLLSARLPRGLARVIAGATSAPT